MKQELEWHLYPFQNEIGKRRVLILRGSRRKDDEVTRFLNGRVTLRQYWIDYGSIPSQHIQDLKLVISLLESEID